MNAPRLRLVIADDHALARQGLHAALVQGGFDVVGAASSGEEAIGMVRALRPNLVLLDIRMGEGMDGLQTAREIRALDLGTRIMMLTLHDAPDYVRAALQAGATGYVLKDAALDVLCEAVRQVLAGSIAVPAALLSEALALSGRGASQASAMGNLTDREWSVLDLVSEGLTNKAIARALAISPATVKAHVERVISKLGVTDRTQAAVLATRWRAGRL